jgi:hypothetical protein
MVMARGVFFGAGGAGSCCKWKSRRMATLAARSIALQWQLINVVHDVARLCYSLFVNTMSITEPVCPQPPFACQMN